jgi:hypothetical protein
MASMLDIAPPLQLADFRTYFPEFASVPDVAVQLQLDIANELLNKVAWGKFFVMAVALWVAHYLALKYNISSDLAINGMRPSGDVGVVTNKAANTNGLTEGSSVSGLVTGDDPFTADFARTNYGLQYLSLMELIVPPGTIIYSPSVSLMKGLQLPYQP